jgi:hypothetical protein
MEGELKLYKAIHVIFYLLPRIVVQKLVNRDLQ